MDKDTIATAAQRPPIDRSAAMAHADRVEILDTGDTGETGDAGEADAHRRKPGQARATFRFLVSQDEEHVRLELSVDGSVVDLGERAHHQTLLLLARERRGDERQGVIASEAGWRDVVLLGAMLGIDTQHINTHLFRAQRQLSAASRQLATGLDLVERRRGQVRFGGAAFEVVAWRGIVVRA